MPLLTSPNNYNPNPQCSRCAQFAVQMQWCVGVAGSSEQLQIGTPATPCPIVVAEHMHLRCNTCGYADDTMFTLSNPKGK